MHLDLGSPLSDLGHFYHPSADEETQGLQSEVPCPQGRNPEPLDPQSFRLQAQLHARAVASVPPPAAEKAMPEATNPPGLNASTKKQAQG